MDAWDRARILDVKAIVEVDTASDPGVRRKVEDSIAHKDCMGQEIVAAYAVDIGGIPDVSSFDAA